MLKKTEGIKQSQKQDIFHSLISKYEKSLYSLGMSEENVRNELAEFIQFYGEFE